MKRAAAALLALAAAWPAAARTVHVGDSGELRKAILSATAGDEILLLPGEYEVRRLQTRAAGGPERPIVVRAAELGMVEITVRGTEGFVVAHPHWRFENLHITGLLASEHAFHVVGEADHTVIRRNRMLDFAAAIKGNGVGEHPNRSFPDDVLIEDNVIHNSAPLQTRVPVTPIDVVGGRRWVVRGNFIADFAKIAGTHGEKSISYGAFLKGNSKDGLFERNLIVCEWTHSGGIRVGLSFGGGGGESREICEEADCTYKHVGGVMRNNIIMNCPEDVAIYVNTSRDVSILNNTIYNAYGIDVRFPQSSATIRNNIVAGGIRSRDEGRIVAENNIVTAYSFMNWLPGAARYAKLRLEGQDAKYPNYVSLEDVRWAQSLVDGLAGWLGAGRFGRNDAAFNEWFLAPALGDYRLMDGSDILGRGAPLQQVSHDFCGAPRHPSAPDLGAIEYSAGACDVRARLARAAASRQRTAK